MTPAEKHLIEFLKHTAKPSAEQNFQWPVFTKISIASSLQNDPMHESKDAYSSDDEILKTPSNLSSNEVVKAMLEEKRRQREKEEGRTSSASQPKRPKFVSLNENLVSTEINKEAFPVSGLVWNENWDPAHASESLVVPLFEFGLEKKQTLVFRMTVPENSDKWGISICPKDHDEFMNVLYHFNPRSKERGGVLIQNDRNAGEWGPTVSHRLSEYPPMFGLTFDVSIQIDDWGFHIVLSGEYQLSFQHREPIEKFINDGELVLEIPRTDDYDYPQSLCLHQVWWGNKRPHPNQPSSEVLNATGGRGGDVSSGLEISSTNLHISNLPECRNQSEDAQMRKELEELFAPYNYESLKLISGKGYGFVNLKNADKSTLAIEQTNEYNLMGSELKVTRAKSKVSQ